MDDLLQEFLTETSDGLALLDQELIRLEKDPDDPELLGNIFRIVHTIKGTCGFLGLPRLESIAHAAENVLGKMRDGEMTADAATVTVVLQALDSIKDILAELEANETEPEGDDTDLITRLNAAANGGGAEAPAVPAGAETADAAPAEPAGEAEAAVETEADDVEAAADAPEEPAADTVAPNALGLTADQIQLIRDGFEKILPAADAVAEQFYAKLFEMKPDLQAMFSGDMAEQGRKLMATLKVAISALEDPPSLIPVLQDLGMRHGGFGVEEDHYATVGQALLATLETGLGDDFTVEARAAWTALYGAVSTTMSLAAMDAPAAADGAAADGAAADGAAAEGAADGDAEAAPAEAGKSSKKPKAEKKDAASGAKREGGGETSVAAQSIRVNVDLLENLMTMVSELVLTRNQLLQILRHQEESEFTAPLQQLNHVTTELQEGVMKTRMQPIGNAWAKIPRLIRDLSHDLGKQIELEMTGAETELDRQMIEPIKDPLTHMIRNAADHGLEPPEERISAGKQSTGTVKLSAGHEGGHIMIQISDDGRGINADKIREKIVSSGLNTEAEVAELSDQQVYQYIFKAGLSTAKEVTNVSGRGVGMDVVKTNIEKIGGTVELTSVQGQGSTFTIKIPLTLAIVNALIVETGGERFAIPQISVTELVRASSHSEHRIERIKDIPVLRLRNRLLPLVSLSALLKTGDAEDLSDDNEQGMFVIVTQVGTYQFGIIVDSVFDTQEIVVKPVAPILRNIQLYSGNTILGDGSVVMILDPNGIAASTGEIAPSDTEEAAALEADEGDRAGERVALLVFRAAPDRAPIAVPLSIVARLEEIEIDKLEEVEGRPVAQYRGALMPIVQVDDGCKLREKGRQPVLVFSDGDHVMGLAVDEIVDIVEDVLDIELAADRDGLLGGAIVDGTTTDILDAAHYMKLAFGQTLLVRRNERDQDSRKLLLVDDSPFFRNLLTPLLSVAGYSVTGVESADEALALRETGRDFDVILSEVDLPGMTGYELASAIKQEGRWHDTPIVAIANRASGNEFDRGREAGFIDYVAKFDRDGLLQTLNETISMRSGEAA